MQTLKFTRFKLLIISIFLSSSNFLNQCSVLENHFSEQHRSLFDFMINYYRKSFNADTMVCHDVYDNSLEYANTFTPHGMIANHVTAPYKFPGELNTQTISEFKKWSERLPLDENNSLTPVGRDEMYFLAKRTRKRYLDFFKANYSEFQHKFRFSSIPRTKQSAEYFAKGLFPDELDKVNIVNSMEDNFVLRFHTRCKLWVQSVHRNSSTYLEFNRFLSGQVMAETLIRISHRLGLNYTLDYGEVKLMLKYCTAEVVWDGNYSPWCHIFSKQELQVLDHADDLRKYYRHSYASEINYRQACPLVKDLIKFLGNNSHETPQAQFLFSHSGSMLKFITAMGLFRDKNHLTRHDVHERNWRGSYIDAFGSNYASVLYRCGDGVDKVLTLYQERPVMIENCGSMLCPLKVLQNNYKDYMKCDFDKICRNNRRRDEYVNE